MSWSSISELTVPKYGITTFQNFNRVNKTVVHNSTCFLAFTESDESCQFYCHIRELVSSLSSFVLPSHASKTLFDMLGEIVLINSLTIPNVISFYASLHIYHDAKHQIGHMGPNVPKFLTSVTHAVISSAGIISHLLCLIQFFLHILQQMSMIFLLNLPNWLS